VIVLYSLKFDFSEIWQKCVTKTAIFVVEGRRQMVEFEGDVCKVPVMPNAPFVFVSLISGEGENQQVTTSLKIRLEPTSNAGDFSEFDQLKNYLSKFHGAINSLKNGDMVAKFSEQALNVINKNILINGDFKINQRNLSEYINSGYTVDRWFLSGRLELCSSR